jgi:uncharacterized protein (DUF952 family)
MREDLIFHLTTKEHFFESKKNNSYKPESFETEGFIPCSKGSQVEATANRLFPDQDQLLLLIIDVSTLTTNVKYEEDEDRNESFPHIHGAINTDAIMDKFTIYVEKDGKFKISFSSDT